MHDASVLHVGVALSKCGVELGAPGFVELVATIIGDQRQLGSLGEDGRLVDHAPTVADLRPDASSGPQRPAR